MATIVINATANKTFGALTILSDLIHFLEKNNCGNNYHLFTSLDLFSNGKKISIHLVKQKNWIDRIIWDEGGLHRFCDRNNITPDLIISMQNTCTFFPNVHQLVYYHQLLPLIKYKWRIFNKNEYILFLYSHFYAYFVKRNAKNAFYSVQLPYIKTLFLNRFKKISNKNIIVIRPNPPQFEIDSINELNLLKKQFVFFYPATALSYKNHQIIIDALCHIKNNNPEVLANIKILFTVSELDNKLMERIYQNKLAKICLFLGSIQYSQMLSYYKSVDALLFPSVIETFGLPLLEAASFGLPIIASDLPYAKEVLVEYNNKILLQPYDIEKWAKVIQEFSNLNKSEVLKSSDKTNSWKYFIDYANIIIQGDE